MIPGTISCDKPFTEPVMIESTTRPQRGEMVKLNVKFIGISPTQSIQNQRCMFSSLQSCLGYDVQHVYIHPVTFKKMVQILWPTSHLKISVSSKTSWFVITSVLSSKSTWEDFKDKKVWLCDHYTTCTSAVSICITFNIRTQRVMIKDRLTTGKALWTTISLSIAR